jgi:hypothetical protein
VESCALADERSVGSSHALAYGYNHGVLLIEKIRDPLEKVLLVKGHLGKKHQVWRVAACLAGKRGRRREPAGVAAHDLDKGDALEVVDVGVTGQLVHGGSNELGRAAVARRVVGEDEVVVDGLGHAHKADL